MQSAVVPVCLPGFSGFIAESHVFLGGFFGNPWHSAAAMRVLTILAAMSIVVTAVYVLRGLGQVFAGPMHDRHHEALTDATMTERLSTGILMATLLIVGVFPNYMIRLIEGSIGPILNRLK